MLVAADALVIVVNVDSCQRVFIGCFDVFDPVQFSFEFASKSPSLVVHCVENIFKLFGTLDTLNESLCNDVVSLNKSPHTVFRFDFRLAFDVSQKKIESFLSKIKKRKENKAIVS